MPQSTDKPKLIMLSNPESLISEIYRSLRFNIECAALSRELKSITITSANRGEGKTTTALNLAIAYAIAGKKVLLLDADLRKPAIHTAFNKENSIGLTSFLANQNTMNEIIRSTEVEDLSFITSGPVPSNPSELLSSEKMNMLLTHLKELYDLILIDTAPALTLSDAKIMAARSDGVLLVVDHGKVKRTVAKQIKDDLTHVKANLIGVVFNRERGSA